MSIGMKDISVVLLGTAFSAAFALLSDLPSEWQIAIAVAIFSGFTFVLAPIMNKLRKRKNQMGFMENDPIDTSEVEATIARHAPNGGGVVIIGGSDNHISNATVRGWKDGVGVGVFDSPRTTVTNADVSER